MSSPVPASQDAGGQGTMSSNGHVGSSPSRGIAPNGTMNGEGVGGKTSPAPGHSNGYSSMLEVPAIPPLRTSVSLTHLPPRQVTRPGVGVPDWRPSVSDQEREDVRKNIKDAYLRNARSVEEMLQLVMALEEEFLYQLAPSRLDYIKNTIQFERRLAERKRQLTRGDPSSLLSPLFARQTSSVPAVPSFSAPSPKAAAQAIERVLLTDPNAAAAIAAASKRQQEAVKEQQLHAIRQVEEREREKEAQEGHRGKRERRGRGQKEEEDKRDDEEEEEEEEGEEEQRAGRRKASAGAGKRTRK